MSASAWSGASTSYSSAPVARLVEQAADAALDLLAIDSSSGGRDVYFVDIAAGPGTVSFRLLNRFAAHPPVEKVNVLITDFAEGMIEKAQARLGGITLPPQVSVSCELMDATSLSLPASSVTHLACMFGVMFLPTPAEGFSEIARVLAPRGRAVVGTWCSAGNADLTIAFAEYLESATPALTSKMRALLAIGSDPADLGSAMTATGLSEVKVHQVELRAVFDDPDAMLPVMTQNAATAPLFLTAPSGSDLLAAWHAFLLTPTGRPYLEGGKLVFSSTANIAVACKP